ncbi:MAG: alpha/beta hydrolase-fold protein [Actinomycetota bacterium]
MTVDDLARLLADVEGADERTLIDLARAIGTHPDLDGLSGADAFTAGALLANHGSVADLPRAAMLAERAHADGVSRAGPLFAMCADQLSLYRGRPQPFGTVTIEHQGDLVQPAVDPAVGDDQRAALGVEPLARLRHATEQANRRRATARAASPGELPPGQPFARIWTDPDPALIRARMVAEGTSAWADGDHLTFAAEAAGPVAVTPVFPLPSWPVGDGLQVLSVRVARLDEAVITYTFTPVDGPPGVRSGRGSHDGRYRGPNAPTELRSSDALSGSSITVAVASDALGEERSVTVYRPPGHERGEVLPVVYATDGNMFAPYARRLDAAIDDGWCPRVVVVAAHAAPADPFRGNQRALEYLLGFDEGRYDAHQRFFVDELAAWAETELGVPTRRSVRAVFGCSDGGGHALTTGRANADRYGHLLAFSTGTPPDPARRPEPTSGDHPFVHLCAGTLEQGFHGATAAWAGYLHQMGVDHHFTERVAGHDLIQWCEELPRVLARAWPIDTSA